MYRPESLMILPEKTGNFWCLKGERYQETEGVARFARAAGHSAALKFFQPPPGMGWPDDDQANPAGCAGEQRSDGVR